MCLDCGKTKKRSLKCSYSSEISKDKALPSGKKRLTINSLVNNVDKADKGMKSNRSDFKHHSSILGLFKNLNPSAREENSRMSTVEISRNCGLTGVNIETPARITSGILDIRATSFAPLETIRVDYSGDGMLRSDSLNKVFDTHSDTHIDKTQNILSRPVVHIADHSEHKKGIDEQEASCQPLTEVLPTLVYDNYRVGYHNFHEILIEVLRLCPKNISIDDFYNLLYNADSPSDVVSNPIDGSKVDGTQSTDSRSKGLTYCFSILESLKRGHFCERNNSSSSGYLKGAHISPLNFHEILRVFLAIKIISDLAKPVKDASSSKISIKKISIYKAYFIICHKLIYKYPTKANSLRLQQNLVLGQPQIGKLIKSVYPGVLVKRLGKRGHSKYHYIGMAWNKTLVDDQITGMFHLELPELKQIFRSRQGPDENRSLLVQDQVELLSKVHLNLPPTIFHGSPSSTLKKPRYTFVDFSSKFVDCCSPRSWQSVPGLKPQQSEWSKQAIQKSKDALKQYGFSFEFLLSDLYSVTSHYNFLKEVTSILRHLIELAAPFESFRNFYLVLLVLIFPIAISSEEEVPAWNKGQFQAFLNKAVAHLEPFVERLPHTHKDDLIIVIKVLRKILYFHSIIRSRIKTSVLVNTLKEIVEDSTQLADVQPTLSEEATKIGQIVIHAVISAVRAFDVEFILSDLKPGPGMETHIVLDIVRIFKELCKNETAFLQESISTFTKKSFQTPEQNFVFEMFIKSSGFFHDSLLSEPAIAKLPMPVMSYIIVQIMNEIQMVSFHSFGKRNKEVSQETFKLWWVYSMVVQEYFSIISEIASLSQMVTLPKEEMSAQ